MPNVTVQSMIDRAAGILQDVSNVRWSRAELLDYLNDAQRQIVVHRPDVGAVTTAHECVADTKQDIPADGVRFLHVRRNTGGAVVTKISLSVLDASMPNWHGMEGDAVDHYAFDPIEPKCFYVFPKPPAGHSVELTYSKDPDLIAAEGGTIGIDDIYANALLDFMLHRAYQKDATYGDLSKATLYLQSFNAALGIKGKIDAGLNQRGAAQ